MDNLKLKKVIASKWILIPVIFVIVLAIYVNVKLAYKGKVQYVTFQSDIEIEGILIYPSTPGPHPAIVLLQGAGGAHQNYDKWYNRFHANALLDKGFAVLAYTKRGSGNNNIDYSFFTYKDLVKDALSSVEFLRKQPDVDVNEIGLMGISESGWFTPEIAAIDGNIKFIINRVSSPFSVPKTVIHERRMDALAEGFSEQEVEEEILPLTTRIWQFYIDVYNDPSIANGPERIAINKKMAEMQNHGRLKKWFTHDKLNAYEPRLYSAKGMNYSYDPLPYLKEIDVPMLYIMAGKDINMPTESIVEFLYEFKKKENKNITVKVYPEAGHYLYRWESLPIEGLYEPGYLDLLSMWAAEQVD